MGIEVSVVLKAKDYLSGAIDKSANKVHELEKEFGALGNRADKELHQIANDFNALKPPIGGGKGGGSMDMGGDMLSNLPGMGNLAALANPYAAVTAGVAALGTAVYGLGTHLNELSSEFSDNRRSIDVFFGAMNNSYSIDVLTAKSGAMSKVFQKDVNELNVAANAMVKEFGVSADEAFSTLQSGLQATNNQMDLNQIREYSTQLAQSGIEASDFVALVAEANNRGIYDDKAIDAVKEAGLKLREQTQPVQDMIDKYGKAMGLQKNFMKSIQTGSLDVVSAVSQISKGLDNVDVKARQEIVTNIFGGAGEDAGKQFFDMMKDGIPLLSKMADASNPMIAKQNKRLELEQKINMQVAAIAPTMTKMSGDWDLLVLKGKVFFYEVVKNGFDWWNDFVEGPTFHKMSQIWDDVSAKAIDFFNQFSAQSEVFGGSLGRQFDAFLGQLDKADMFMSKIFGEHYINDFFSAKLDGVIAMFETLNKVMLSVEEISSGKGLIGTKNKQGIMGGLWDVWTGAKSESPSSKSIADFYNQRDDRSTLYMPTGNEKTQAFAPKPITVAGLTASERDKKKKKEEKEEKGLYGVAGGGGGVKNITVNLNVQQNYNLKVDGVNGMGEIKGVADNSAKIVMDAMLQEIRNYEDII